VELLHASDSGADPRRCSTPLTPETIVPSVPAFCVFWVPLCHKQGDESPNLRAHELGKAGDSRSSRRSVRDTNVLVRAQEAQDLRHSMQEAMIAYKKLLKHEVQKEAARAATDPTLSGMASIAIETPVGKALLPTLTGGTDTNPAKLELSALKDEQDMADKENPAPVSAAKTLEAQAHVSSGEERKQGGGPTLSGSAATLLNSFLSHAKFEGGAWDSQEASPGNTSGPASVHPEASTPLRLRKLSTTAFVSLVARHRCLCASLCLSTLRGTRHLAWAL
jgi:hypothetical protein